MFMGMHGWHARIAHEQHQHREQHPHPAEQVETIAPADGGAKIARNQQAEPRAHRHAKIIERRRQPQLRRPKPVRQQGCCRRGQRRFPDADQRARDCHRDKTLRRPAGRGQQAPQRNRCGDQPAAVHPVRQYPHEQPGDRIEDDEEQPGQQAILGIGQPQFGFDEIGKAGEQLAIDEIEDVDDDEQREQPPS